MKHKELIIYKQVRIKHLEEEIKKLKEEIKKEEQEAQIRKLERKENEST
jgi:hypothetical protein